MSFLNLKARYAYARVSFARPGVEAVVGVEVDRSRDISETYAEVRQHLQEPVEFLLRHGAPDDAIAEIFEQIVLERWPGRSYFIEVAHGNCDEWVQVFEPHHHNGENDEESDGSTRAGVGQLVGSVHGGDGPERGLQSVERHESAERGDARRYPAEPGRDVQVGLLGGDGSQR